MVALTSTTVFVTWVKWSVKLYMMFYITYSNISIIKDWWSKYCMWNVDYITNFNHIVLVTTSYPLLTSPFFPRLLSAQTSPFFWIRSVPGRNLSVSWSAESADFPSSGRWLPITWMPSWNRDGGTRRRWGWSWMRRKFLLTILNIHICTAPKENTNKILMLLGNGENDDISNSLDWFGWMQ